MKRYNEICIIIKVKYARMDRFLKNSGRLTHITKIVSRKREKTFSMFESIVESAIKVKKAQSGKGFPRRWPHIDGAHVLTKSSVSSRLVSWFPLEWLRWPTRCPRAPFAKHSRCQSQENADPSGSR